MRRRFLSLFARQFTVIALESSADDTCAAVVTSTRHILSNVVLKQHHQHEKYGGIHPAVAVLEHQKKMPLAIQKALEEARLSMAEIDGIAFTRGPGIPGCLGVACNSAKALAAALNKPLVGVHHMQAHALTALLTSSPNPPSFPFLTLLISGGHTLIVLARSWTSFEIIASTLDEAIGRTFDKISRMLQLPWHEIGPGAALDRFCSDSQDDEWPCNFDAFPLPMPGTLAFSYAALHSHLERYLFKSGGIQNLNESNKRAVARAFQLAAFGQLEEKLILALQWCEQNQVSIQHLIVSGGVAANSYLRARLQSLTKTWDPPLVLCFPPPSLCTDNAAMIAWAAIPRFLAKDHDELTIAPQSKWSIQDLDMPS